MAKRKYMSPVLFTMDGGGIGEVGFGGSQTTLGYDYFEFEDEDLKALCLLNFDQFQLQAMAGDDQMITWAEYEAYIELHPELEP